MEIDYQKMREESTSWPIDSEERKSAKEKRLEEMVEQSEPVAEGRLSERHPSEQEIPVHPLDGELKKSLYQPCEICGELIPLNTHHIQEHCGDKFDNRVYFYHRDCVSFVCTGTVELKEESEDETNELH